MGVQIQGDTGNVIATKGTYSGDVSIGGTLTYEDVTNIDSVGLITARQGIEIGTGVGVAASISVDGNAEFAGIVTASSSVKVGGGVTISESGIEASGIGITVANINGAQIGGRRNLIINGAMHVAQRATSSTDNGYGSVDRMSVDRNDVDEDPTQEQTNVASGTTPYSLGFRKCLKVTNGNQTGGAGEADFIRIRQRLEAREIACSGWNYTSTSSFITLSFWVKASVAQTYQAYLKTSDGTAQGYVFEYALSADTWTKVVKTFPGNSNLTFDTNTYVGFEVAFMPFMGTNYTSPTGSALNVWNTWHSANSRKDMTSTWYTTNDSTFELTGIQLEVGPQATSFEHRSFSEELALCQRYCYVTPYGGSSTASAGDEETVQGSFAFNSGDDATIRVMIQFPQPMRFTPTYTGSATNAKFRSSNTSNNFSLANLASYQMKDAKNCRSMALSTTIGSPASMSGSSAGFIEFNAAGGYLKFESEL